MIKLSKDEKANLYYLLSNAIKNSDISETILFGGTQACYIKKQLSDEILFRYERPLTCGVKITEFKFIITEPNQPCSVLTSADFPYWVSRKIFKIAENTIKKYLNDKAENVKRENAKKNDESMKTLSDFLADDNFPDVLLK